MKIDEFLHVYFHKNPEIIGGFAAATLLGCIILLILEVRRKDEDGGLNVESIQRIETILKKTLQETVPAGAAAATASGEAGATTKASEGGAAGSGVITGEAAMEIEKLHTTINEQNSLIQTLQQTAQTAKAAAASGEATAGLDTKKLEELMARNKELEARLHEYEIIEDDIADLSLFKQENERLKQEIEKLKSGNIAGIASPAAHPASPEEASVVQMMDQQLKVSEPAAPARFELKPEPAEPKASPEAPAPEVASAPPPTPAAEPAPLKTEVTPTGLADIAAAMAETAMKTAEAPAESPNDLFAKPPDTDKLLAELDAAPQPAGEVAVDEDPLANIDTDKMMQEMASAEQPAKASDGELVVDFKEFIKDSNG